MAIVTRRYVFKGICEEDLANEIGASLAIPASSYFIARDITFDDAIADIAFVDELMEESGFLLDALNTIVLSPLPFLGLVSPSGDIWRLLVSDLGALTTLKVN